MKKMKIESKYGEWTCHEKRGEGANGIVYRVTRGSDLGAVKVYKGKLGDARMIRFTDEIEAMKRCAYIDGVLPILDVYDKQFSPEKDQRPWFVMGLAMKITDTLGTNSKFGVVVEAIHMIATTLTQMHALGVSHRDIKPDNLFSYSNVWAVGDFGLADFDGKAAETQEGEKLGPMFYIAPEMLNQSVSAKGEPADVYSLAKVFWVLATGQKYPLPGSFNIEIPALTISAYNRDARAGLLDQLIMAATLHDPSDRPTMADFADELNAWLTPPLPRMSTDLLDLTDYASDFLAIKLRNDTMLLRKQKNDEVRSEAGKRIRETFRPFVEAALDSLKKANFANPSLNIDNYMWGFELRATVPWKPWGKDKKFVTLMLNCQISIDESSGMFKVISRCTATKFVGSNRQEFPLWEAETTSFMPASASENCELNQMISTMYTEFRTWVAEAIAINKTITQ